MLGFVGVPRQGRHIRGIDFPLGDCALLVVAIVPLTQARHRHLGPRDRMIDYLGSSLVVA